MKQELTLTFALLATGCWLVLQGGLPANFSRVPSPELNRAANELPRGSDRFDQDVANPIQRVSNQTHETTDPSASTKINRAASAAYFQDASTNESEFVRFASANSDDKNSSPSEETIRLGKLAQEIRSMAGLSCSLELSGIFAGQRLEGRGQYLQKGLRTGKYHLELMFNQQVRLNQVCDGRFLYQLQSDSTHRQFDYLDLKRIQQKEHSLGSPGMIGIGGIGGLLDQISKSYELRFRKSDQANHEIFEGELAGFISESLRSGHDEGDPTQHPLAQIPELVRVVVVQTDLGKFPAEISFSSGRSESSDTPLVQWSVQFASPVIRSSMDEKLFTLRADELESTDLTGSYVARMEEISNLRMATLNQATPPNAER